ncbi:ACBP5 [Symbiodinium microadriaticum]|nr:ACBP5 [Symbiodinium sp. KB8]CAE7607686.1 ACBP5 [Symbiodinium microadriaticum]
MKKMAVFLAVLADAQVNTWTELSPAGSLPTARHKQAMAYSQADDSLYLYGGHNGGSSCFDDLQQYNRSANTWSELSPGGSPPSARCDHDMVWSDADEAIYLFGGYINESTSAGLGHDLSKDEKCCCALELR